MNVYRILLLLLTSVQTYIKHDYIQSYLPLEVITLE